jgi:A/G-specific adenine glycosylase
MEELTRGQIREAGRILTAWYAANKRDLPWRKTRDPYAVWISEVMLQQTRVDTAIRYYERFMDAFPTVAALAEASPERVLKAWEGRGYYSRAANLHRGARFVMERLGGALPPDPKALKQIPGIGPYSAGAIASIAFGLPEPAVDGNVLRVVARVMRIGERVDGAPVRARIRDVVREMTPEGQSASFCQALMELGALVCLPGEPACSACPLEALCWHGGRESRANCPPDAKKPPAEQPAS